MVVARADGSADDLEGSHMKIAAGDEDARGVGGSVRGLVMRAV
jgi:hypothetical protein